jgi:hypothetical protein
MKTIVPVMEELGLKRIVSLTGADAVATSDTPGFANRLSRKLIGIVGGKVIADGEEHIRILQASSLNWTIVRSPVMLGGQSKPYRLTVELAPPYISIRRQSVADAMLSLALNDEFNQQLATILPAKQ